MKKSLWPAAALALCLALPVAGRADPLVTTISFDEPFIGGVPNPAAPSFLYVPGPLTEFYGPMGVHFSGVGGSSGGAVLTQDGGFGIQAHSGTNFLAFNRPFGANDPERISFDVPVTQASIWAAGGFFADTFQMQAFDSGGNLLSTTSLTTQGWQQFSVSGVPGDDIASVVLTETAGLGTTWVYDDLSYTADPSATVAGQGVPGQAPEPGGLVLLALGGVGLAGWRWRMRFAG